MDSFYIKQNNSNDDVCLACVGRGGAITRPNIMLRFSALPTEFTPERRCHDSSPAIVRDSLTPKHSGAVAGYT